MIISYINKDTKTAFLNSFADYIVKNLEGSESRIKITDHENFVVINGETNSKKVLNLNELRNTFLKEKSPDGEIEHLKFNIIDIVKYDVIVYDSYIYHFTYYNSKRPIYHPKIVEFVEKPTSNSHLFTKVSFNQKLIFEMSSKDFLRSDDYNYFDYLTKNTNFPHGVKCPNRTAFYYGEYICNHLFDYLNVDEIHMKMNLRDDDNEDFDIQLFCDSIYDREKVQSLVLDVFDFNLLKFESDYLSSYDFDLDTTDPIGEKPWLVKDKIKDILIF